MRDGGSDARPVHPDARDAAACGIRADQAIRPDTAASGPVYRSAGRNQQVAWVSSKWVHEVDTRGSVSFVSPKAPALAGRESRATSLSESEAEENVVLEFRPQPRQEMLVACLYSHWQSDGEGSWSFAAITDEPPQEVAAAGHDRCIVSIKEEKLDAWLSPNSKNLRALYAILDDRKRPHYEYQIATLTSCQRPCLT